MPVKKLTEDEIRKLSVQAGDLLAYLHALDALTFTDLDEQHIDIGRSDLHAALAVAVKKADDLYFELLGGEK